MNNHFNSSYFLRQSSNSSDFCGTPRQTPTMFHKFHNQWELWYKASKLAVKWNIWMPCVSVQRLRVCLEAASGWLHTNRCIVNSTLPDWPRGARKTKPVTRQRTHTHPQASAQHTPTPAHRSTSKAQRKGAQWMKTCGSQTDERKRWRTFRDCAGTFPPWRYQITHLILLNSTALPSLSHSNPTPPKSRRDNSNLKS